MVVLESLLGIGALPGGLYMERDGKCIVYRTGSTTAFRKQKIRMWVSVGTQASPLLNKTRYCVALQKKPVQTHIIHARSFCFVCVCFVSEGMGKLERKKEKQEGVREQSLVGEQKTRCCEGQRTIENLPVEGELKGLLRVGIFNVRFFHCFAIQ